MPNDNTPLRTYFATRLQLLKKYKFYRVTHIGIMKKLFTLLMALPLALLSLTTTSCSDDDKELPDVDFTLQVENAQIVDNTIYVVQGDTLKVTAIDVTAVSGIENISINAQVGIYPNPVVETLYVTCNFNCQGAHFCIYGENGAVVYNETQETIAGVAKAINVANLPDGLYILKVTTDQGVATYPVVKK